MVNSLHLQKKKKKKGKRGLKDGWENDAFIRIKLYKFLNLIHVDDMQVYAV